ncbi:hypothetical protein T12_7282 [Trichinella patagoniensis]|uniref:Uncharacterized protein n=1 Tax=Trichinella patagoniensis TaxID=990121 RepID=A0A0V0YSN9_9BILA|nr:hypothetical protein T12_7282 [Trichinella patagoniensis]
MYRLAEVEIAALKSGDAFRPMFIHCGSHPLENRKLSDSRRLSGRGRGFFIIYCGDGLRFIGTSFFLEVPFSPFYMPGARLPGRFQRDLFD